MKDYRHVAPDTVIEEITIDKPSIIAVDTETWYNPENKTAISKYIQKQPNNEPFGVSIYYGDKGFWITEDLYKLKPILENKDIAKVLHNCKFDISMLKNIGLEVEGDIWDTMIMAHLIDSKFTCKTPNKDERGRTIYKQSKKLKDLAYHYFDEDAHDLEDAVDKLRSIIAKEQGIKKKEVSYKVVSDRNPELMKDYAIADTEFTYRLYPIFKRIIEEEKLDKAYDIDIKATKAVIAMERQGIRVDITQIKHDKKEIEMVVNACVKKMYQLQNIDFSDRGLTPKELLFNPNSTADLVYTFAKFGVMPWKWKTGKCEDDTSKKVILHIKTQIQNNNKYLKNKTNNNQVVLEFIDTLLLYRRACKVLDTYINGILDYVQWDDKVHCDYWISPDDRDKGGTKTGRLSSANPNMQNIPKKPVVLSDELTINVRNYFIADDNHTLVFIDYDQQEYRLLGHYSKDANFMQFIKEDKDIHKATASMMFGVPYDDVTSDQRSKAKTINFGLIYGLGVTNFAVALGYDIDADKCQTATRVLYKHFKPWEVPPHAPADTEDILNVVDSFTKIEQRNAIRYYLKEETQSILRQVLDLKKKYFNQFPSNKEFIKLCTERGKRRGYVKTWVGSRIRFKDPNREAYKAPNGIIQGGCGIIMKDKLHTLTQFLQHYKTKVINSVHDECAFMVHNSELHLVPKLKEIMEDLPQFSVPLTVGVEHGKWGEKKPWEGV